MHRTIAYDSITQYQHGICLTVKIFNNSDIVLDTSAVRLVLQCKRNKIERFFEITT